MARRRGYGDYQWQKPRKTLGRPRVSAETEDAIRELRAEGKGMTAISKALGVGCSTVTRVLAE